MSSSQNECWPPNSQAIPTSIGLPSRKLLLNRPKFWYENRDFEAKLSPAPHRQQPTPEQPATHPLIGKMIITSNPSTTPSLSPRLPDFRVLSSSPAPYSPLTPRAPIVDGFSRFSTQYLKKTSLSEEDQRDFIEHTNEIVCHTYIDIFRCMMETDSKYRTQTIRCSSLPEKSVLLLLVSIT